jgi:hypothetical protein
MIYEKRTYRCSPGRMSEVLHRFEHVVLALWQRHGYRPVGFWTEWLEARTRTDADGPLVEKVSTTILAPTAFSPLQ